ncbi:MAG: STAS domain-containing protein [Ignavibacterium sp.]|nr:STAS domain-containing protein [Ignavibacterium sp.]
MDIVINDQQNFSVIKLNKKSVLGNEGVEFHNSVLTTLDKGVNEILIDLSMVEYITSWGIGMLVHAFTTTTNRNAKFVLTGVGEKVFDILAKVRLNSVFTIKEAF